LAFVRLSLMNVAICSILFLCTQTMFAQSFGVTQVLIYPSPVNLTEAQHYNWYKHPTEKGIFIISFEQNLDGFRNAFDELNALLTENNIDFNAHFYDKSHFSKRVSSQFTYDELHESIIDKESKVFRTWNVGTDFLTLLLSHDSYVMILGSKNSESSD